MAWAAWASPRFPSPLIEPDVRISRIRLSDWLHHRHTAAGHVILVRCDDTVTGNRLRHEAELAPKDPDRLRC